MSGCEDIFQTTTAQSLLINPLLTLEILDESQTNVLGQVLAVGKSYTAKVIGVPLGFPADARWGLGYAGTNPAELPLDQVTTQCSGLSFTFTPTHETRVGVASYYLRCDVFDKNVGITGGKQTIALRFHATGSRGSLTTALIIVGAVIGGLVLIFSVFLAVIFIARHMMIQGKMDTKEGRMFERFLGNNYPQALEATRFRNAMDFTPNPVTARLRSQLASERDPVERARISIALRGQEEQDAWRDAQSRRYLI